MQEIEKKRKGGAERGVDDHEQISMTGELLRKTIHLSSLGVPLIYWFVTQATMLTLLVPATILSIGIEIARRRSATFDERFRSMFGSILRPHERSGSSGGSILADINGATFVLLAATISVALFAKVIALTAFTVLIISDTAAALIGRRFGRHTLADGRFGGKSVEGSVAFFVTAVGVTLFYGLMHEDAGDLGPFMLAGVVASLVATGVEVVSQGGSTIDDNITIPISFGGVMWILWSVLAEGA